MVATSTWGICHAPGMSSLEAEKIWKSPMIHHKNSRSNEEITESCSKVYQRPDLVLGIDEADPDVSPVARGRVLHGGGDELRGFRWRTRKSDEPWRAGGGDEGPIDRGPNEEDGPAAEGSNHHRSRRHGHRLGVGYWSRMLDVPKLPCYIIT